MYIYGIMMMMKEGDFLIKYKIDIIQALKNKGYSTYKIRKEKIFNESQLQQMRENKILAQDALNKVCTLLDCQPGDILVYIPDNTPIMRLNK